MFSINRIFPALLFVALLGTAALADPPARVARINYLSGDVSFKRGDVDGWARAVLNYPMAASDSLWTDDNARAELHAGSTAIRLAGQTSISFLNLDDRIIQIRLAKGSMELHLARLGADEVYEVDTPDGSVSLLRVGDYRIDVDDAGNSTFTTRHGQAEVTTENTAFAVVSGQQAFVNNTVNYNVSSAPPPDEFELWANDRERREEQSVSAQYVSREVIGYEDLDAYGRWVTLPDYGRVWTPLSVAASWAPYQAGQWVWSEPYGWTWVSVEPWGFAPYHYGRWAFVSSAWYWVPGPVVARPIYAPALVAFVGGSNWNVSLSFGGGIGWFPLGPGEIYRPIYHVSEVYARSLNPVMVTKVYGVNSYVNRSIPGAVTVVSQSSFIGGRVVTTERINVPLQTLRNAPLIGMNAPFAPSRESLYARSDRTEIVRRPPAIVENRVVLTRQTPAQSPIPFAARQRALAANPGRPLEAPEIERMRGDSAIHQEQAIRSRPVNPQFDRQPGIPARMAPGENRPFAGNGAEREQRQLERPGQAERMERAPEARERVEPGSERPAQHERRPEKPERERRR